jgi:hypothetical protein
MEDTESIDNGDFEDLDEEDDLEEHESNNK